MRMKTELLFAGPIALLCALLLLSLGAEAQTNESASSPRPLSERAKKGKAIFQDHCFLCHDVDSERVRPLGPSLSGLFKRKTLLTGKPVGEANLKEVIQMGPTPGMPGFRYMLSDQEVDDLMEYLKVK